MATEWHCGTSASRKSYDGRSLAVCSLCRIAQQGSLGVVLEFVVAHALRQRSWRVVPWLRKKRGLCRRLGLAAGHQPRERADLPTTVRAGGDCSVSTASVRHRAAEARPLELDGVPYRGTKADMLSDRPPTSNSTIRCQHQGQLQRVTVLSREPAFAVASKCGGWDGR
ncbi:uncharacterized protein BDZ99DRAFT_254389 [Mytilinidion resinicola]|uniref:Uncharacterized protein n=1 Tax=Mytilinidion resinicola TaxID=574789 RepID=A0A6A6YXX3_9PEZI|nr:uncharacterized protein BDZ99DRAFT_254389 [Mytilinidion resinicola]KAF2813349.1 hypothetical protein BDZ99DRAFT_254389 [Mytilinidion resinicola]